MLEVRTYPDPVLRRRAEPVRRIDQELLRLAGEMFETMYGKRGVGLAAPQVGRSIRLCVINCSGEKSGELALVNPIIVESSGEHTDEEGCLSVPGIRTNVTRAQKVKVRAYDLNGQELELEADELQARAVQHELDHLEGRLFFQRLNEAARMTIAAHLRALEEEFKKK